MERGWRGDDYVGSLASFPLEAPLVPLFHSALESLHLPRSVKLMCHGNKCEARGGGWGGVIGGVPLWQRKGDSYIRVNRLFPLSPDTGDVLCP